MTLIRSSDGDAFLNKALPHTPFFLIFGQDTGLVRERVTKLLALLVKDQHDPFQLVRLDGHELHKDPTRLLDEAQTIGLFKTPRVLLIESGERTPQPALTSLFELPQLDVTLVIEAGALRRDAALRRLFEQDRKAIAIECELDTPAQLGQLIAQEAYNHGLTITHEAKELLVSLLGADRMTTRMELEKLFLYAHGRNEITLADIETIISDGSQLVLDGAIHGAFSGKFNDVSDICAREFAAGFDPGTLLGFGLRYALTLHQICLETEAQDHRLSLDEALQRAGRYPLHIKKIMAQHARLWSRERLAKTIEILSEAIHRTRLEAGLAKLIAMRALWSIAFMVKGGT